MENIEFIYRGIEIDPAMIYHYFDRYNLLPPEEYVGLASKHDGAIPKRNSFTYNMGDENRQTSFLIIPYLNGVIYSIADIQIEILGECRDKIVFAVTGEGHHLFFDYTNVDSNMSPSISLILHDETDRNGENTICYIASDFQEFIHISLLKRR